MRTLKFRAWDESNKVIHHNFQFLTSGDEGNDWILFTSDEAPYEKDRKEGVVLNNPYFRQQLKVMQFTGLHDKNGKEIYEGDLVKVDSYYIGDSFIKEHRAEIKYGNGGFYIDYDFAPELCEEEIYNEQIEVIGNIYESP